MASFIGYDTETKAYGVRYIWREGSWWAESKYSRMAVARQEVSKGKASLGRDLTSEEREKIVDGIESLSLYELVKYDSYPFMG